MSSGPNDTRGDRWLPRLINRLARVHPRLGMLRFEEALRRTTPRLMQHYLVPGVQVSFCIGDSAIRTLCFGVSDAGFRTPLQPATVFALSSTGKPFTALGALTLVRDGLIRLDEPVHAEIGAFFGSFDSADRQRLHRVTLRHLLSHTSGLAHFNPPRQIESSREVWLKLLCPRFERDPGTASGYSGVNYALAQVVMEVRTGANFPTLMRDRVLDPLGMVNSRYERETPLSTELLASDHDAGGKALQRHPSVCPASSGLVASTAEVCRGFKACHDLVHLMPMELSRLQLTPQPPGLVGATATLGLHLHRGVDTRSLSHGGTRLGHRSLVVIVPESRGVLCIASNSDASGEIFKPITGFFRAITIGG